MNSKKLVNFNKLAFLAPKNFVMRALLNDSGAQFVEYALLAGLIGLGAAGAVIIFGEALLDLLRALVDNVSS